MNIVNFILQGKGGVGKSLISSVLAQYYLENKNPILCYDTDPINATLLGFKALPTERLVLIDNPDGSININQRNFDKMMEKVLTTDSNFIIDNGASSFVPLANYLIENNAIDMIVGLKKQVILHTVVTGGQSLLDTLSGFNSLAEQMPPTAQIVVWLNPYFGEISQEGKQFEDTKVYQKHKDRIMGIVRITNRTANDTSGKDFSIMLDKRLTFQEAIKSKEFNIMEKQRLKIIHDEIFEQLALVI